MHACDIDRGRCENIYIIFTHLCHVLKGYQTYGVRMCWHILSHCLSFGTPLCLLGDRMSQIAEPSRVQLCLCNPNRGGTAKSSLLAVVSHPGFCAVVVKRALRRVRDRLSKETSWRVNSAPFWNWSACHLIQFLLTVTLSECGLHG